MNYNDFFALLKAGALCGAYLFEGTEEYIKAAALREAEKALLPEGMEQLNETVLENPPSDVLIAAAETLPFLAEKRLVVVRELASLTGRVEAEERLLSYLLQIPQTCVLIFYANGKTDARKKIVQALKKNGTVVSFQAMDEASLCKWLVRTAKGLGKVLSLSNASRLSFTVGSDAALLRAELEKLAAFAGDREEISREDVDTVATRSVECTVFEMVDAVVADQQARAFSLLHDMLLSGSDRVSILVMLLRQYRLIFHTKVMQQEKLSQAELKKRLGLPSFAADRTLRQAAGYTGRQARQAMELCLEAEYCVKSGRWNQEGALEKTMLDIFSLRSAPTRT